jgi:hypothetical protein
VWRMRIVLQVWPISTLMLLERKSRQNTINNTDWNVSCYCKSKLPKTYTWSGTFILKDGRYTFNFLRPVRLTPGKGTWYPLNRSLDGPYSRTETCTGEKNFLLLLPLEPRTVLGETKGSKKCPAPVLHFSLLTVHFINSLVTYLLVWSRGSVLAFGT